MDALPADTVRFWDGPFSNFAPSTITLPCPHSGTPRSYATVEHYFQASKAATLDDHSEVARQPSPRAAKAAGRRVALRADWENVKYDVMLTALRAKFRLPDYAALLIATGERPIAEDSPTDFEWGIRDEHGGYGGRNLLGRALMQVREELRPKRVM